MKSFSRWLEDKKFDEVAPDVTQDPVNFPKVLGNTVGTGVNADINTTMRKVMMNPQAKKAAAQNLILTQDDKTNKNQTTPPTTAPAAPATGPR